MIRQTLVFLVIILVFPVINIRAQNTFRQEWAFGVSGGVDFATVSFRPKVTQQSLQGYLGGVTVRYLTEKNLGIQLEINLKQQGWDERFEPEDEMPENSFYTRRMTYIDIPLLTHIYFGSDKFRAFLNLGPQIGFFMSENTAENLNGAFIPGKPRDQHSLPVQRKFEWGLGGGPGIEFRSGIGFFLLEGRYYYALSDFYNTLRVDPFSKASNQVISVKLTYLMPLKRPHLTPRPLQGEREP
ncbi:MAG: PorT family protein [Tannerella sp.]|jgi:hypothetical protein|nr:PorT family protein [Tannerella sp.]